MTVFPPAARPFDASWIGITFTPADGGWDATREYLAELANRLSLAAAGGVPVSLIAGSAFGLDLRLLALLVLAPVLACVLFRMVVHPRRAGSSASRSARASSPPRCLTYAAEASYGSA